MAIDKKQLAAGALFIVAAGLFLGERSMGCGQEHDSDPHDHYDLPGYYNGPMVAHGGNKAPAPAAAKPSDTKPKPGSE